MDFNCIVCDKEIKQIAESLGESPQWEGCYDDGIVQEIHAGYGSRLDGDKIVIAICDVCIDKKVKSGKALYTGDYLFPKLDIGYVGLKDNNNA